jgi:hypothetical protein
VQRTWLPLVFLLLYAFSWLGWWLWKLFMAEEAASQFPDLDEAWEEAMRALAEKQISLNTVPIFLILGTPQGGEKFFFQAAAGASQDLAGTTYAPQRDDAPLRVIAGQKAVFVTCASACLLAEHARVVSAVAAVAREGVPSDYDIRLPTAPPPMDINLYSTLGAMYGTLAGADMMDIVRKAKEGQLSADEAADVRAGVVPAGGPAKPARGRASILDNAAKANLLTKRLQHVCRLIGSARYPDCPINGILLLIPFAGTADDALANDTGLICQRDLDTVMGIFQLRCPYLALVCDLEKTPGFDEFIKRIPTDQRKNRLGFGHPWLPAVEPHELPEVLANEVEWIVHGVLVSWIYKLFEQNMRERSSGDPYANNAKLFRFLCHIQERKAPLTRILGSFVRLPTTGPEEPFYYGGCYLAGTGDSSSEQAFVPGVLMKLVEGQDSVAWTTAALTEDESYRRRCQLGYAGLVGLGLVVAVLAWLLWK